MRCLIMGQVGDIDMILILITKRYVALFMVTLSSSILILEPVAPYDAENDSNQKAYT